MSKAMFGGAPACESETTLPHAERDQDQENPDGDSLHGFLLRPLKSQLVVSAFRRTVTGPAEAGHYEREDGGPTEDLYTKIPVGDGDLSSTSH